MTQTTSMDFNMTAGHGQIRIYCKKAPFKFVFVVCQSILFYLSPNGRDNKCIEVPRELNAVVNGLTLRGEAVARDWYIRYRIKYYM